MISRYSYLGTDLHTSLPDEVADAFNRVQGTILMTQLKILLATGVKWTPIPELNLNLSLQDEAAYTDVLNFATATAEAEGRTLDDLMPQITGTHLIKV